MRLRRTFRRGTILSAFRSEGLSRALALALCGALFVRALVPIGHVPPPQAGIDPIFAEGLAAICHADPTTLDVPAEGSHNPGKRAPTGIPPLCPICLAAHLAGTFMQPVAVVIPAPTPIRGIRVPTGSCPGLAETAWTPAQPRAPPLVDM